jgi:hypothetical protein
VSIGEAYGEDDIRTLADAIVDVLEERGLLSPPEPVTGVVLTVAEVAGFLGRSRWWVYEHSAELGAFRFGNGPKARIGFDRDAIERWKRDRRILQPAPAPQRPRRGRRRKAAASAAVELIPYDSSPYRA